MPIILSKLICQNSFFIVFRSSNLNLAKRFYATKKPRPRYGYGETITLGGYLLLAFPTVFFALGCWQVDRLKWKRGLIAEISRNTKSAPKPLPEDISKIADYEYCPVYMEGEFDHSKEILITPRSFINSDNPKLQKSHLFAFGGDDKGGAMVVTPFKLIDRDLTVLVNRGWVPRQKMEAHKRQEGQVTGPLKISGLIRKSESNPWITCQKYEENKFTFRDIPTLANFAGTALVFIDAFVETSVPGGPIGGQSRLVLRDEHLAYIITWYLLSVWTFGMWFSRYFR